MASVINDYESIKKFRRELLKTVDKLRTQLRKTEQAMDDVATVWKDLQFQKYHKEFSEDKEQIPQLCAKLNEYESDVLYPLEEKIRKYLEL